MKTNLISVLIAITIFAFLAVCFGLSTSASNYKKVNLQVTPNAHDCDSLAVR